MGNELISFFEIRKGNIVDAVERWDVDALVNAAHPTLRRGKGHCVDAAINERIDALSGRNNRLWEVIQREWKRQHKGDKSIIKCKRGDIFVTSGDKLCRYIIHTVGPKNDKNNRRPDVCSSSCINTLKSCYKKLTLEALQNVEIKKIAIPVLSAGNYKMDFEVAFKVAISEIYNTLLEQKQEDPELFGYSNLEKVYLVIDDTINFTNAQNILKEYREIFEQEKRITVFKTWESQAHYFKEIQLYDSQKGYFSIAKFLRMLIVGIRFGSLYTYLKDWIGKEHWERRRQVVEVVVVIKMFLPLIALVLMENLGEIEWLCLIIMFIMGYGLIDTITYLLELIILADIQNPSANIIRSMIMLFINYFEAAFEIAAIGYAWIPLKLEIKELIAFALIGQEICIAESLSEYMWLSYLSTGVQFFFVSIALGYFANHLRQRKFRTN